MITEEEFNELVKLHGFSEAIKLLPDALDVDDIPGIEKHWFNHIEEQKDDFEEQEKEFYRELDKRKTDI